MPDELTEAEERQVLSAVRDWMWTPNVVSMRVGRKARSGAPTDEVAIVVGVLAKKAGSELSSDDVSIPPEVEVEIGPADRRRRLTIATDVIEEGEILALALDTHQRPCPGGYKIACNPNGAGWQAGTLGIGLLWGKTYVALTNCHVVTSDGRTVASAIFQPDGTQGGAWQIASTPATVLTLLTCLTDTQHNAPENRYDIAWIPTTTGQVDQLKLAAGLQLNDRIGQANKNDPVSWIGQATGVVASGKVDSTTTKMWLTIRSGAQTLYAFFVDAVEITPASGSSLQSGDSGAALIRSDGTLLGLIYGYSGSKAYACALPPMSVGPH